MYKVIVAVTTYNLELYIEEALDSILAQETKFDFKIIIADDASTDKTPSILKKYKEKYRDKINLILNKSNMGSLANSNQIFHKLNAEYFTFLDGDDIWLNKKHLQQQVDFLDSHRGYSMCAGNTRYYINGKPKDFLLKKKQLDRTYTFEDFINNKMPFFHTSSILVRNNIFLNGLPSCYFDTVGTFEECALRGEDFRRLIHLKTGPLYAMNNLYSYYRIHENGVWQGSSSIRKNIESAIAANFYRKYFSNDYQDSLNRQFFRIYKVLMRQLVINYNLLTNLSLDEKDMFLFTSLLTDMAKRDYINTKRIYKTNYKTILGLLFHKFLRNFL